MLAVAVSLRRSLCVLRHLPLAMQRRSSRSRSATIKYEEDEDNVGNLDRAATVSIGHEDAEAEDKLANTSRTSSKKEPRRWRVHYEGIRKMRAAGGAASQAPVDVMGCDALPESDDPKIRRFELLVSLMLSSQTKDEVRAERAPLWCPCCILIVYLIADDRQSNDQPQESGAKRRLGPSIKRERNR